MPRSYATPLAFKTAVEQRLRNAATASGMDLQRKRQLFVFDRFLASVHGGRCQGAQRVRFGFHENTEEHAGAS